MFMGRAVLRKDNMDGVAAQVARPGVTNSAS
jgi:hypothetical protein